MAKIRYAVIGIDPKSLGNLIGTLARGEVEGPSDVVVLPAPQPIVYAVGEAGVSFREVAFNKFLADVVVKEQSRLRRESTGEELIKQIVEESKVR
jgi:hypothetical protein